MPLTDNQFNLRNTLDFLDCLSETTLAEDEILVSYDVSSLFTQVPLEETIDHIIHKIYTENKLPKLGSKTMFKRLLLKSRRELCSALKVACISRLMVVEWVIPFLL